MTASASGPVGLNQFSFKLSPSNGQSGTTAISAVGLYAYTDSAYSQPISGQNSSGQIGALALATTSIAGGTTGTLAFAPNMASGAQIEVPAGQTYYFELRGTITGVTTGSSVVTVLNGDSNVPAVASGYQVNTVAGLSASNFIWSGNSNHTSAVTDTDWSNGYSIPGLPSSGLIQSRSN